MKKDYTLISFLGKNSNSYDYVEYLMPENGEGVYGNDTSLALIEAKKQHWNITKAIIIGTYSSNWFELVSEQEDKTLHDKLVKISTLEYESDDDISAMDSALDEMTDFLQGKYQITIIPVAHRPDLSDKTVAEIAEYYDEVYDDIADSPNILIDITHGYRHMPILLFQVFQQHMLQLEGKEVEIVYGERYDKCNADGSIVKGSIFRDLREYWDVAKRSDALNRFVTEFDGTALLPFLKQGGYQKVEKWVRHFTNIVKSNYIMQVNSCFDSLPSVIDLLEKETQPWLKRLRGELEKIWNRTKDCEEPFDKYLQFAHMLDEKRLLTQAIVALDVTIQSRMAEYKARVSRMYDASYFMGDYRFWQGSDHNGAKQELESMLPGKWVSYFKKFYKRRNLIAHGGGEAWNSNIISETAFDISKCFELVDVIFETLDQQEKKQGVSPVKEATWLDELRKSLPEGLK